MAEPDMTRELIRRAFAAEPFDADAGLAEVVRRAGRATAAEPSGFDADPAEGMHPQRRRPRGLLVFATFAGVMGLVLTVGFFGAGRLGGGSPVGVPAPVVSPLGSVSPVPVPEGSLLPEETDDPGVSDLPSNCASGWTLAFAGDQFQVTDRGSNCPPLRRDRLVLLDANPGTNGLIRPGSAVVWPITGGPDMLQAPFSFRVAGLDKPVPGHTYELIHVDASQAGQATAGADSYPFYRRAVTVSLHFVA
jgi:hypothetical protein